MTGQNDDLMAVTYSSLDHAAGVIEKQAKDLDASLEALQTKIRSISDHFEGEAKTAADGMHKKWDKDARAIHEALMGIARAVRDAGPKYQAGDRKAAGYYE
ncbi:WXG100 family type VII secretion target [Streptomyces sp. LP05-1]|uniref:ESAT-6-like protein n=1 Tax=Streptomyces pyxinae TaxID=2970734 RepID=A0ABT2CGF3_9ACTN|nr:WXG100 family type VII secretion target [Streptomyces sp. LP05-1]MCS0636493.1 WXG100 family type VII secretion target [Streptomyces sp. LP05-1]